jgi:hypothetical protein
MKVVVLFRPKTESEGIALDFAKNYQLIKHKELSLVSLDTVEGDNMAKLYDITQNPAVLAIEEDGHLGKMWQGGNFPLLNELDYYTLY